jgi:hypothetical protein
MSEPLLIARCALAVVLAVAAVSKLADLGSFRKTLAEFDVRPAATRAAALAVPLVELALAVLLVPTATARGAALGTLALLAVFCLAIARVLRRGDTPDCGCFGSSDRSPISRTTLTRNAGLGAVAALVAITGPGAGVSAAPVAILAGAALIAQGWFSWQLFRQHGRLLERVRALEAASSAAPPANLSVIHRHRVRPDSLEQRVHALGG